MNAGQHPGCGHLLSKRGGLTQRGLVDVGRLLLGNVCLNSCVCVCNSGTASLEHLQRTMCLVTPESDLPMMWHRPVVHVELVVLSLVLFLFSRLVRYRHHQKKGAAFAASKSRPLLSMMHCSFWCFEYEHAQGP